MNIDPAAIVLGDGHTTVKECLEHANEMHDSAAEEAEACNDDIAGSMSEGAAMIELLCAKLADVKQKTLALQARCCGSDDLCNGCRALLEIANG